MTTQQQLDRFYQFATERVESTGDALSLDELYLAWRARNRTESDLAESVAAVTAALTDLEQGELGEPARPALRELCAELGLALAE
jgi:hypothetical protein